MTWHVTMMLADSAEAVNNKLYILGGGWSVMGPDPVPTAIAVHIKVPWDRANERHKLKLELLDSDGQPVNAPKEAGGEPMLLQTEFEVGRAPGLTPGTPIDLSLAVKLPPLALEAGQRYEWRLTLAGKQDEDWRLAFAVR